MVQGSCSFDENSAGCRHSRASFAARQASCGTDEPASTSRYSRMARSRPTKTARLINAWPIDTSARCGSSRKSTRFCKFKSCPAFTPSPRLSASLATSAYAPKAAASLVRPAIEGVRVRLGVQLDAGRADRCRPSNRLWPGINEETHADAGLLHPLDRLRDAVPRHVRRPSRLARDLPRPDRHERALIRAGVAHELQKIWARISLDVELDAVAHRLEDFRDGAHILWRDVPPIGARMNGDPSGSRRDRHANRLSDARDHASARVAKRRDFVDVDAQVDHGIT